MQQTKKFKMADAISPYLAVSCGLIYHNITYDTAITMAESELDIRITTDTP